MSMRPDSGRDAQSYTLGSSNVRPGPASATCGSCYPPLFVGSLNAHMRFGVLA